MSFKFCVKHFNIFCRLIQFVCKTIWMRIRPTWLTTVSFDVWWLTDRRPKWLMMSVGAIDILEGEYWTVFITFKASLRQPYISNIYDWCAPTKILVIIWPFCNPTRLKYFYLFFILFIPSRIVEKIKRIQPIPPTYSTNKAKLYTFVPHQCTNLSLSLGSVLIIRLL